MPGTLRKSVSVPPSDPSGVVRRLSCLLSLRDNTLGLKPRESFQRSRRQAGQVKRQLFIAFQHLPMREMVAVDGLVQFEQYVGPPVSFQTPHHFFAACLDPVIDQIRQLTWDAMLFKNVVQPDSAVAS